MTDMLHKPIGWDDPLNQMTDGEWQEYFRLRKELDVEMSEDEIDRAYLKADKLLESHKEKEAYALMKQIPLQPRLDLKLKKTEGLKEVMYFNLSLAKKEFPNEF